jgi:membrane protease YdiL (CAAX protease family)
MSEEWLERDAKVEVTERYRAPWRESLPSSRVPHLGHALLFVSFAGMLLFLAQLVGLSLGHATPGAHESARVLMHPKLQLAMQSSTYILSLASCFLVFPMFWERGFLAGLNWNGRKAIQLAARLVPLGIATGLLVQAISSLIPMPKTIPMDDFFKTPSDVWLVTLFGTVLAPLFEEITFRGFLLPAFAIAFDWLGPMLRDGMGFSRAKLSGGDAPRYVAAFREDSSAGLSEDKGNLFFRSRTAVVAASVVSSVLFALLHAEQLAHAWAALGILFGVSLVLTTVRVRTRSVACSTLVHASYNLSVFLLLFFATGGYRHLDKIKP